MKVAMPTVSQHGKEPSVSTLNQQPPSEEAAPTPTPPKPTSPEQTGSISQQNRLAVPSDILLTLWREFCTVLS